MLSSGKRAQYALATTITVAFAAGLLVTGCSSQHDGGAAHQGPAADQPTPNAPADAAPIGVSAGGVTTRIDVPAESTEEQYAQSCLAAKEWMAAKGGNPHDQVEPLLKHIQSTAETGPLTFRRNWAGLSTAEQAAVIIAVRAAADGGC